MCFSLQRGAHFCKNMKAKCIRAKNSSKSHLTNCIFDAYSYQDPSSIVLFPLARQPLVFVENHKISRAVVLGRPGGMRGVRDLQIWDLQFRTLVFDSTRQLLPYGKGGGFKRYAHSAGPETQKKKMKKKLKLDLGTSKFESGACDLPPKRSAK